MSRTTAWTVIIVIVTSALTAFGWLSVHVSRGGDTTPLHSIRRFDPYGSAALHRLMLQRAEAVYSLERPRLRAEHHGVLVQVLAAPEDSLFSDESDEDLYSLSPDALLKWVASGNTIIQFTRHRTALMDRLGLPASAEDVEDEELRRTVEEQQRKGTDPEELIEYDVLAQWREGSSTGSPLQLSLRAPLTFDHEGPEGWTPTLTVGRTVYGGAMRHGEGSIIFVGAPTPALNHYLAEADNLTWITQQLDGKRVIFDEWAHGIGHGGTILETLKHFGLTALLLQVPVLLLCYRWMHARRHTTSTDTDNRRRSSVEQLDTLGRLLDQSWDPPERSRRVYGEVVTRFSRALRCRPEEVEARLTQRSDAASKASLELLRVAQAQAGTVRPRCPACGYDLTTLRGDRCPECGHLIPPRVRRLTSQDALHAVAPVPNQHHKGKRALAYSLDESARLSQELLRARR